MKKFTRDIQHYLPLVTIFLAGILGYINFSYDKAFQIAIVVATAAGYVTWGIVHHYIHKDLHLSVVIEYIMIAALGVFIAASLMFRA